MNPFKFGKIVEDDFFTDRVEELDLDYERLWMNLNLTDRKIMSVLSKQGMGISDTNMRMSTAYSALQRLVKKGYVIKSETFEIEDPFFSRWIFTR